MDGVYYDGKSTDFYHCSLTADANGRVLVHAFIVEPAPVIETVALKDVTVSKRVGNTPRFIYLPGGASFETEDHQAADQLNLQIRQAKGEKGIHGFTPHQWESSFRIAVFAGATMAILIAFLAFVGIPGMSGWLAEKLPADVNNALGEGTLEILDERYFQETKLVATRQIQLQDLFAQLTPPNDGIDYQLYFRTGGVIGANAFALPNGQVVLTDELVALANSDHEIRAVLLHEIAHVDYRHSLEQLLSALSLFAIYGMMIGDLDTMNNIMVYLPVILVQTGYSRQAEWEADGYALNRMLASNISPQYFADIMRKLDQEKHTDDASDDSSWWNYLSSHPVTQERIQRFENAIP